MEHGLCNHLPNSNLIKMHKQSKIILGVSIMHRRTKKITEELTLTPNKILRNLAPEALEKLTPEEIEFARNLTPKEVDVLRKVNRELDRKSDPSKYKYTPEQFTSWQKADLDRFYKLHRQIKKEMKLPHRSLETYLTKVKNNQNRTLEYFQTGIEENDLMDVEIALTHFHRYNLTITDEQLEEARNKNNEIFNYLEKHQEIVVQHLIETMGAVYALKIALNYHVISTHLLIKIIYAKPDVVNEVEYANDGNTLLHQLIIEKDILKIKSYLSAIFTARCMGNNIPFDSEKKNKANQTVLQLSLSNEINDENKEIVSAVLVYGNSKFNSVEKELAPFNILIGDIIRERSEIMLKTIGEIAHWQQGEANVLLQTNQNVGMLAIQQGAIDDRLNQVAQVTALNHIETRAIGHFIKQASSNIHRPARVEKIKLPDSPQRILKQPAVPSPLESPSAYNARNPNLFTFSVSEQKVKLTKISQHENSIELLKSVREEMDVLRKDIQQKSNRLAVLEQTVMRIESSTSVEVNTEFKKSRQTGRNNSST
jgi:hypothetical protein